MKITGQFDAYAADELRQSLLHYVSEADAPSLDLSGIEGCDVVGVQLLASARRSAELAGKRLTIFLPSQAVQAAFTALGGSV